MRFFIIRLLMKSVCSKLWKRIFFVRFIYSGNRVKGLIFCSRVKECEELSKKFNELGYRTVALSGNDNEDKRQEAFERLAMDEEDATEDCQPLDYIFSRGILNEGWEFSSGKVAYERSIRECYLASGRYSVDRPNSKVYEIIE